MPVWATAVIAGAFGLFYAYMVWNAVAFLVDRASRLYPLGWTVLLLAVVMPILVFAGAFALGQRRRAWQFALLMLTGLGLVCVFWLNVLAYSWTSGHLLIAI